MQHKPDRRKNTMKTYMFSLLATVIIVKHVLSINRHSVIPWTHLLSVNQHPLKPEKPSCLLSGALESRKIYTFYEQASWNHIRHMPLTSQQPPRQQSRPEKLRRFPDVISIKNSIWKVSFLSRERPETIFVNAEI